MKTEVHGNLTGLRDSLIEALGTLYDYEIEDGDFLPRELQQLLARFTAVMNREIALYLTRDGSVADVSVGTDRDVELRDYRLRRSSARLSCVRCVHTHPNGDGHLSDVDLSALRSFRYDAMVAIGCRNGEPTTVQSAFLGENNEILMEVPVPWYKVPDREWNRQILLSDELVGRGLPDIRSERERAVLMGIESEESLAELARLADTAGAVVVGTFLQKRDKPDNALLIGRGRAEELSRECQALEADLCILDEELSGIQARNLEELLRVRVIDRTTLILDIFAQRASSAEGKLQVELAQLTYRSARLVGAGVSLSRLGGGIGTRGPGESQLEINRRRIRERMNELNHRLEVLQRQRDERKKNRRRTGIPVVALVGYTNAGKSTLLNRLTGSEVYVQDQLFATLDAVSRRVEAPGIPPFLLVDTVGFIRKLPHTLVSAFRSTLEEAAEADVLLLVSDGASEEVLEQHDTVEQVLHELGAEHQPRIDVLNKCDLRPGAIAIPGAIPVSAKTGEGLEELLAAVAKELNRANAQVTFAVPFSNYGLLAQLRPLGQVLSEEYTDEGAELTMILPREELDRAVSRYGNEIVKAEGGQAE